jgi:hypothetical protein
VIRIKNELATLFELKDWVPDPFFFDFIGYIWEGGFVHEHTDPCVPGREMVRINILIRKPDVGGMPIVDGHEFQVEVGDVWLNPATRIKHSCTEVRGPRPRSVLSLGFQIPV